MQAPNAGPGPPQVSLSAAPARRTIRGSARLTLTPLRLPPKPRAQTRGAGRRPTCAPWRVR